MLRTKRWYSSSRAINCSTCGTGDMMQTVPKSSSVNGSPTYSGAIGSAIRHASAGTHGSGSPDC